MYVCMYIYICIHTHTCVWRSDRLGRVAVPRRPRARPGRRQAPPTINLSIYLSVYLSIYLYCISLSLYIYIYIYIYKRGQVTGGARRGRSHRQTARSKENQLRRRCDVIWDAPGGGAGIARTSEHILQV